VVQDNFDSLGGIIDPLDNASYEIDSSTPIFEAMDFLKSKKKTDGRVSEWINIKKPELVELILETYVDKDKKKILNTVLTSPKTIPEMLELCNLEATNGYRKIKFLRKSGLIKPVGYFTARNRKKIKKYLAVIDDVKIYIGKELVRVLVRFKKDINQV
jgi:hypothetical protein